MIVLYNLSLISYFSNCFFFFSFSVPLWFIKPPSFKISYLSRQFLALRFIFTWPPFYAHLSSTSSCSRNHERKPFTPISRTIAITLGRLGFVCPHDVAPHLQQFAQRWSVSFWFNFNWFPIFLSFSLSLSHYHLSFFDCRGMLSFNYLCISFGFHSFSIASSSLPFITRHSWLNPFSFIWLINYVIVCRDWVRP